MSKRAPHRGRVVLVAGLAVAVLGACGDDDSSTSGPTEGAPRVVVTTSILGDVVRHIAGDLLDVQVIMGPGVDPHEHQPSARDVELLQGADLVVESGGLEGTLHDAIEAAEADGVVVFTALDAADPLPFADHDDDHEGHDDEGHDDEKDEEGHDHGDEDPHFWQDPQRMALVVDTLGGVLAELPGADAAVATQADDYAAELRALDTELEATLAVIPAAQRLLVTDHDAFGYFAARYDFTVVGAIVPGGGTEAEVSARDLAALADAVRAAGVRAVFSENTLSPRTAEALAREAGGAVVVVQLFSDALGDADSGGASYVELLRTNTERIADALT